MPRGVTALIAAASCFALLVVAPSGASARVAYVTGITGQFSGAAYKTNLATGVVEPAIDLGGEGSPPDVAISPDGKTAYIADLVEDRVVPIDIATNVPGADIPVGSSPIAIAISPDGTRAYTANRFGDSVSPLNLSSKEAGAPIPVGAEPTGVAVTPNGRLVYVTNRADNSVSVIDTAAGAVVGTIPVGVAPSAVGVSPDGARAYVTNQIDNTVSVIDTAAGAVVGTIPVEPAPSSIAVTPNGTRAYALGNASPVSRIDLLTDEADTPGIAFGGDFLGDVAILPNGTRAYVTNEELGEVVPIEVPADTLGTPSIAVRDASAIAIVPNQGPVAAFAPTPASGAPGDAIAFDAAASSDSDGSVARYDWDFGDGSTAVNGGATPSHSYTASGTYTVTLTVTDNEGCSTAVVFPGQTAYCNGTGAARTTRTVTIGAAEAQGVKRKKKRRCPTVKSRATTFVPRIVPGHVVPGVRVRLSSNRSVRLVVQGKLLWSQNGESRKTGLGERSRRVNGWIRLRFPLPAKVRSRFPYGHRVKVRLRILTLPRVKSTACRRVLHRTIRTRVAKVFPNAVQRGELPYHPPKGAGSK